MITNDVNSVDYTSAAITRQMASLTVMRDLLGGTKQMRYRGQKYLQQEEGESLASYRTRLARSLLFNAVKKTLGGLVGMVLKTDPVYTVPTPIKALLDDIDQCGHHADTFLRDVFYDAVSDGHALILIDMEPELETSITSAAPIADASDEEAAGRRPYWVKYKKDQVRNFLYDRINGEEVLTRITLRECSQESDGKYGDKEVIRYRVFTLPVVSPKAPGRPARYGLCMWTLHEEIKSQNTATIKVQIAAGVTTLNRIPIVAIYTNRTGFLESEPPLIDLAHLNVGHWQQWSDIINQLRYLGPILCERVQERPTPADESDEQKPTGAGKPLPRKLGPYNITKLYGKDADIFYRSHDGEAIDAASKALADLERRISAMALSILTEGSDAETTATKDVLNAGERVSELMTWARALKDGGEMALYYTARYMNLDDGGTIEINVTPVAGITQDKPPTQKPLALPPQPETGAVN